MNESINKEFVEKLGVDFLWNIIDDYISKDVNNIKNAIKKLGYIESDDINKITSVAVQDSEEFIITDFNAKDGALIVRFEMPSIIIAQSDNKEVCFSVTTVCVGTIEIPDVDSYDWNSIKFEDMSRPEILAYGNIVKIITVSYEDIEADDLMA